MKVILFSLSLRLYLARIAIACSLWLVTASVSNFQLYSPAPPIHILLFILVILHHATAMISLRFFYGIIDLLLLMLEIAGITYSVVRLFPVESFFPETFILHVVLVLGALGCLVGLLMLRLATIVQSRGRSLITPFDIYAGQSTRKTSLVNLLMGRSIWMLHFVGEQMPLRLSRGFLGLIFLCILLFWILQTVIFAPTKETALGPIKEYRTRLPPLDVIQQIEDPVWNIQFPVPLIGGTLAPIIPNDRFFESVNVKALWSTMDDTSHNFPECLRAPPGEASDEVYVYGFLCPNGTAQDPQTGESNWVLPDLLISINFTNLRPGKPINNPTSRERVSHVVIGLTNSTHIVESLRSVPFPLVKGINIAASIVPDLRQIYSKPALAALGIFQTTTLFWDPRIVATYADPNAEFNQDFSTLRLFWQDNWGETSLIQDFRQNTVIDGFASVGGLWTTFSGIFAVLFGASMLQILYGQKPLSIFGLAHSFHYQRMKKETLRLYPNIIEEHKEGPHRGLLSLIRDHLIGLSFIDNEEELTQGIPSNTDEENHFPSDKESQLRIQETDDSKFGPAIRRLSTPRRSLSTQYAEGI